MVLGAEHIRLQVVGERFCAFGVVHIELQMFRVIVVATKNRSGVPAKRLVYDGFDPVAGDDGPLGRAPDDFGRHQFLGDDDDAVAGLDLHLVRPRGAIDLAVSIAVRDLRARKQACGGRRVTVRST